MAAVVFCGLPAFAQQARRESAQELQRLEQQARQDEAQARKLEAQTRQDNLDIKGARGQLIAAANKILNLEEKLTETERTLGELEEEESRKGSSLYENRQKLARVLSALQRIAIQPPEAILAAPGDPLDTVRSAIVLERALPGIEQQVSALRRELATLAELRERIRREREELLAMRQTLETEQRTVKKLIGQKKEQEKRNALALAQHRKRAKELARKARSLRELIARLKDIEAAPGPGTRPEKPQGPRLRENTGHAPSFQVSVAQIRAFPERSGAILSRPARGAVTKNFGQSFSGRPLFREGIVITTRPLAQVVAPYDGRVVYAGAFRGYGKMIIIEHRASPSEGTGAYHSLIAGASEIAVLENQLVLAGEPLAWMQDSADSKPEIYYELRRGGRPINPRPWLKG